MNVILTVTLTSEQLDYLASISSNRSFALQKCIEHFYQHGAKALNALYEHRLATVNDLVFKRVSEQKQESAEELLKQQAVQAALEAEAKAYEELVRLGLRKPKKVAAIKNDNKINKEDALVAMVMPQWTHPREVTTSQEKISATIPAHYLTYVRTVSEQTGIGVNDIVRVFIDSRQLMTSSDSQEPPNEPSGRIQPARKGRTKHRGDGDSSGQEQQGPADQLDQAGA